VSVERDGGGWAASLISGDCGQPETGLRQGPFNRKLTKYMMMEFISRVVTTSSTFSFTLSKAGMSAQSNPPRHPASTIKGMITPAGALVKVMPTQVAATAPAYSCPSAPILKYPEVKAKVTAIPVRISGVDLTSTSSAETWLESGVMMKL